MEGDKQPGCEIWAGLNWCVFGSGGDEGAEQYELRVAAAAARYPYVIMLGDSMGATGALLYSHLATAVHAFCPQVSQNFDSL